MALTPEQRALIDLVRDRGLSYEEIGELTGMDVGEARARAEAAFAALGDAEPGEPAGLGGDGAEQPPPGRTPSRFAIALGLGAICLLVAVLAVAGVFSEDQPQATGPAAEQPGAGDQEVARIELAAVGGSDAQGIVAIGVDPDNTPYLDLDLEGLEPASEERLHMLWVDVRGGRGLPLPDPIVASGEGIFQERFPLPLELVGILEVGRTLEVVLTNRASIERVSRAVSRAGRQSRQGELDPASLPERPGEPVLRGRIPS